MTQTHENSTKYFTQNELRMLFNVISKSNSSHCIRDLALFRVAYRCGLRASEISLLHLSHYNSSQSSLYCQRLKGSRNNTIRLDSATKMALDLHIKSEGLYLSSDILFKSQKGTPISRQTLNYLMKKYCSLTEIEDKKKYHFHTLKHSIAIHLAESDMDIKELQWWLGHKSVSNTEIYFQFTTKQQEQMYSKLSQKNELV